MISKGDVLEIIKSVMEEQYKLPHRPTSLEAMQYIADSISRKIDALPDIDNVEPGDYWGNVTNIYKKQVIKGINTYGQRLEQNQLPEVLERITYQQEELIDALVYCEWIKDGIKHMEVEKNG